jgi:cytidine deaminase
MADSAPSALLDLACSAAEQAYSPYSKFRVGCALVTAAGSTYTGCNVENASHGLTICAERSAVFQAIAAEGPSMKIATLAVICLGHEFPPCGACRQVISEFATADTRVWFLQKGEPVGMTMAELLPAVFNV